MSEVPSVLQVTDIWQRTHALLNSDKLEGQPLAQAYLHGVEMTLDWILGNCVGSEIIDNVKNHPLRDVEKGKFEFVLVMMYREEAKKEKRL